MKKFRTKLGELIGSPEQAYIKVTYKGHVYNASEYDMRYISVLISNHFLKLKKSRDEVFPIEVAEFLKSIGISAIHDQIGNRVTFRCDGRTVSQFPSGFYDTASKLSTQLYRNDLIREGHEGL